MRDGEKQVKMRKPFLYWTPEDGERKLEVGMGVALPINIADSWIARGRAV
jgi:hypothetical protein